MAHIHDIIDDDKHFVIDPTTRTITNLSGATVQLMQYDHNSERFTFEIPRYIENHDMSISDIVEVHYTNVGSGTSISNRATNPGIYEIDDLHIDSDDENTIRCSWLISQNATLHAGTLKFQLKFKCYDSEDTDIPSYIWNSNTYDNIVILPGLNNTDAIEHLHPDIFKTINDKLDDIISLPEITEEDDGKMVIAEDGEWIARYIENYEEVEF